VKTAPRTSALSFHPEAASSFKSVYSDRCHLFRCALATLALLVVSTGLAAEVAPPPAAPPPAAPVGITKPPLIQVTQSPAALPKSEELKADMGKAPRPIHLMYAGLSGFFLSLLYLSTKLSRYWRLGVLTNIWSLTFVLGGTLFSVLVLYASSPLFMMFHSPNMQPLADLGPSVGGSLFGTPFFSLLQRFFGRRSNAESSMQPKDVTESTAKGFFFDRIMESVGAQINLEINQLSIKLDWVTIDDVTHQAIKSGLLSKMTTQPEADKARSEIEKLVNERSEDPRVDGRNKYDALAAAVLCVSFTYFRRVYHDSKGSI
jgi:hypothetical protein